jgi:Trichohyalin-plectin-homology domain
LLAAQEY